MAPVLERNETRLHRTLLKTLPCLLGLVLVLAGFVFGRDWLKQRREAGRPLPPAASPNVLLVVLDTVRPDHLSLYGYGRSTSPTLERMARQGIRFDGARATAPWTLASHASLFTGRLPHELGVKWMTPLGRGFPTLAEYLGSHGYATAGFVGNTLYCSYDSGLSRGFTHYEDFDLDRLGPFRTAQLVDLSLETIAAAVQRLGETFGLAPFRSLQGSVLGQLRVAEKKDAGMINREFFDWLSRRPQPGRPFFAFLNEFDAHSPYLLPRVRRYRFGMQPRTDSDYQFLKHWSDVDKARLPQYYRTLIGDCYDSCLAYMDERLGELFDELQRRGLLDNTLVIITADHGEGLGEHGLFDHGESLYRTEIRVPLLFVIPASGTSQAVVHETVSLRDLPATIADLVGLGSGSPFPGRSLAALWQPPSPEMLPSLVKWLFPSSKAVIPPIPIRVGHRQLEAHWSRWPRAISFTSVTSETAARNCLTSAMTLKSLLIEPTSSRCNPSCSDFGHALIKSERGSLDLRINLARHWTQSSFLSGVFVDRALRSRYRCNLGGTVIAR